MRQGAEFIISKCVKKLNLNYIVKRLGECADLYDDCRGCRNLIVCRNAYDVRCGQGLEWRDCHKKKE